MIFLYFFLLILGLAFVVKGADFLIDGSSSIARTFKIPEIVIGLTIISMGTSAPELIVNIFASVKGSSDIVFGNVIGSNLCNLLLILGLSAVIFPITVKRNTVFKEIPFTIIAAFILLIFANFTIFNSPDKALDRFEGAVLLILFVLFLFYVYRLNKNSKEEEESEIKMIKTPLAVLFVVLGFAGLFIGGKLTVDNAVNIAKLLGVSEKLIALTIISIGTSLPELATSAIAAYKKRSDIAIGNVVGSNIFNILFILGVSGIIRPVAFQNIMNIDIAVLLAGSVLLFAVMFIGKRHILSRAEGAFFLFGYVGYMAYLIIRG
ncbi:MAG TPA: calcium/sodium antiporter [Spirochaetota bacterium]|nr:calcium/sodium antiporter [Spirochaetota bacterium]